jgi:hypothetical protein
VLGVLKHLGIRDMEPRSAEHIWAMGQRSGEVRPGNLTAMAEQGTAAATGHSVSETPDQAGRWRPLLRSVLAIGLTAIALWATLMSASTAFVAVMFGQLIAALAFGVGLVIPGLAIAGITRVFTGRFHVAGAVTVTVSAIAAYGIAQYGFGTIPMIWVPTGIGPLPGFELVHVVIALCAATVLGLFIGPTPMRIVGAFGLVALIGGGIWVALPDPVEPPDLSAADLQEKANYESFIDDGVYPMVVDLPSWEVVNVTVGSGPFRTQLLTADGGGLEVVLDVNPLIFDTGVGPCWYLAEPNLALDATDSLDDYAAWCTKEADVWSLTDGTGYARMQDGGLVVVKAAADVEVGLVGGDRPADATEVAAAWQTVRPMTEPEVRRYTEDRWMHG